MLESAPPENLSEALRKRSVEGELYEKQEGGSLRCFACGHRCLIREGRAGICRVRYNEGGKLYVPFGYAGALQLDPVEKKPFFHAYPGFRALSFGMLGCDFHCAYCQNWVTSQALRDPKANKMPDDMTAEEFVELAIQHGARVVTSTYNEPLITSEWAVNIFKVAKSRGLVTSYVSNGNGTPEVLTYLKPWVDLYKVDLKSFDDKHYHELGGVLGNILDTIGRLHTMGFWLEIVSLLIPGFNDSEAEIKKMAKFLASVSTDIPWHVTAFHKDYQMQDPENTPASTLIRAAEIGKEAGLHFVYAGNLPGKVGEWENTYCPSCRMLLVERFGFTILDNRLKSGCCPQCGGVIPGRW